MPPTLEISVHDDFEFTADVLVYFHESDAVDIARTGIDGTGDILRRLDADGTALEHDSAIDGRHQSQTIGSKMRIGAANNRTIAPGAGSNVLTKNRFAGSPGFRRSLAHQDLTSLGALDEIEILVIDSPLRIDFRLAFGGRVEQIFKLRIFAVFGRLSAGNENRFTKDRVGGQLIDGIVIESEAHTGVGKQADGGAQTSMAHSPTRRQRV